MVEIFDSLENLQKYNLILVKYGMIKEIPRYQPYNMLRFMNNVENIYDTNGKFYGIIKGEWDFEK